MGGKKKTKLYLQLFALIIIIASAFAFSKYASGNEVITTFVLNYGYIGILLASVLSGINIIIPIPVITFLPLFLESGLNFWGVIILISAGLTIGDLISYSVGRIGREIAKPEGSNKKIFVFAEKIRKKYYWSPLFLLFAFASFVPFPNEVLVLPLGFLGYRLSHIFIIVLLGNLIFNYIAGIVVMALFQIV